METQQVYLNPQGFSNPSLKNASYVSNFSKWAEDFNKTWTTLGQKIDKFVNDSKYSSEEQKQAKKLYENATGNVTTINSRFFQMMEDIEKLPIEQPLQGSRLLLTQMDAKANYQTLSTQLELFKTSIAELKKIKQLPIQYEDFLYSSTRLGQCKETWKSIYEESAKPRRLDTNEIFDQKEISQDRPRSVTYEKEKGGIRPKKSTSWNEKLTNFFHPPSKPLQIQEEPQSLAVQEDKYKIPTQPMTTYPCPPLPTKLPPLANPKTPEQAVTSMMVKELTQRFEQIGKKEQ